MLERIQEIAKDYGFLISYEIINQINNGEGEDVKKGLTPKFTFTVYVTNEDGDEIDMESHDTLEVALKRGIEIAEREIKS